MDYRRLMNTGLRCIGLFLIYRFFTDMLEIISNVEAIRFIIQAGFNFIVAVPLVLKTEAITELIYRKEESA